MSIYEKSGYVDIPWIIKQGATFIFIVGARGTGKTYSALKMCLDYNLTFMLMRRTQTQIDLINKPQFSPFKKLNDDLGLNVTVKSISEHNSAYYLNIDEKGKPIGKPIGYTCALSTISKMRGFDASDVDILIYDEFIPERHEQAIKLEGDAFTNAYETINRNRELQGNPPVICLCMANSNDLNSPILVEFNIVKKLETMSMKNQEWSLDLNRGVAIVNLCNSKISQQKSDTALYKAIRGGDFYNMAINNQFSMPDIFMIKSEPLQEFIPLVTVCDLCVYRHKDIARYYVTRHCISTEEVYSNKDSTNFKRFLARYAYLYTAFVNGKIKFESYADLIQFKELWI